MTSRAFPSSPLLCLGTDPPECCQPAPFDAALWAEHDRRLRAARTKAEARQPKICPACGSPVILPTFLTPRGWECGNLSCLETWEAE